MTSVCAGFITLLCLFAQPEKEMSPTELEALKTRVRGLLSGSNVDMRPHVDEVFKLADVYRSQGKSSEARKLYDAGLQVDPWRLEYQISLVGLLDKDKEKEAAAEKLQIVCTYTESEEQYEQARSMLAAMGRAPEKDATDIPTGPARLGRIIVVPVGKVNHKLLAEVLTELERVMGFRYEVTPEGIDPGPVDRPYATRWVESIYRNVTTSTPQATLIRMRTALALKEEDLKTYEGQKLFVRCYAKLTLPDAEFKQFGEDLQKQEADGQCDAERLLSELRKRFRVPSSGGIKGYLGVTEADIFSKDNNFLFGLASASYGVMSYHRFRAAFNESPPNRPLLVKRTAKQCVSSSCLILGIPRCSTPTCARAYPNSLEEHDRKDTDLCTACRKKLAELSSQNEPK